jgi:hypothetical protein
MLRSVPDSDSWERWGEMLHRHLGDMRDRLDDEPVLLEQRLGDLEAMMQRLEEELARVKERIEEQMDQ